MFTTIEETAPMIKNGVISPVHLVEEALKTIKKTNATTRIFITVCEKNALEEARKAEEEIARGHYRGLLHGIPYSCKDLFKTAGVRTTGGSKVFADYVPEEDAFLVKKLKQQGAILLGKTNQHELAFGITGVNPHYGTVSNPFDPDRLAGGSSSGSAAAVALGLGFFSLGTDTGGSVRVPASLCGVVGLKPTYGILSCEGVIPYCWSLDHVGIFNRTVNDSKLVMSSLLDYHFEKGRLVDQLAGVRIGIPSSVFYEGLDPEIEQRMKEIQEIICSRGAEIAQVQMPDLKYSRTVSLIVQLVECLSYHSRYLNEKGDLYGEDIKAGMTAAQFILAEHYVRAKRMINLYKQKLDNVFEKVDCILTPTTPCVAPKKNATSVSLGFKEIAIGNALTMFTSFFCMTGNPAISIPCGKNSQGMPFGAQIICKRGGEELIFSIAMSMEKLFQNS